MGLLPATVVTLRAEITEFQSRMAEARGELDKMQAKGESSMSSFGTFGAAAFMAVGAAAIGLGTEAIHLADTFEISHARLTAALVANGTSFDAWSGQIGAADQAGEKLGFTNAQVEDGLARLETMVKDPTVALRDLAVAEDVARARGIDLTTAANLVGKASEGTYTALVRLGVVTKDQAASFISGAQAVDFLGKAFGGQAAAFSETFAGKLETLKATTEDLGKNLGLWLIPKIEAVASALSSTIHFIEDHKAAQILLAGVITAVVLPALTDLAIGLGTTVVEAAGAAWASLSELVVSSGAVAGAFAAEGEAAATAGVGFDSMLGPIGLVIGAIGALALAMHGAAQAANNVGNTVAGQFLTSIQGTADPVAKITAEIDLLSKANARSEGFWDANGNAVDNFLGIFSGTGDQYHKNAVEITALNKQLGLLKDQQTGASQATALGAGVDALDAETKKQLAQATKDATAAVKDATTAATDYFDAAVSADRADIAWADKTDALTLALKKSHDSISLTNADGRSARGIVDDLVTATDKNIVAVLKSGVSADQMRPLIQGYVDKLDATATAAGMTKAQVDALNVQYGLTKTSITTQITLLGVATAEQQIATMSAGLYALGLSAAQVAAQIRAGTASGPAIGPLLPGQTRGPVPHAAGGTFSAGERMLVGERGPELVSFGTGGMVTPNNQLGVAGAGGGGGDLHVHFHGTVVGPGGMDAAAEQFRLALLRRGRSLTSIGLS